MSKGIAVVHFDLDSKGAANPGIAGCGIPLMVIVGYPGSKITDLLIGGYKVQIPNEAIKAAEKLHDEICDTEGG